eukprot:TRINITY_DN42379_c0_g1_i1.p1 TRINITY_DN42379_c0_g1~~TRINITY_DN42379_c0_g1_i1.p1  ORF type:complete len:388 (-),score=57.70 TRINITY_DN42379_c0_g1_i1:169-1332(-)
MPCPTMLTQVIDGLTQSHHDIPHHDHDGDFGLSDGHHEEHGHGHGASFLEPSAVGSAASVSAGSKAKVWGDFLSAEPSDHASLLTTTTPSRRALRQPEATTFLQNSSESDHASVHSARHLERIPAVHGVEGINSLAITGMAAKTAKTAATSFLFGSSKSLTDLVQSTPPSALVPLHAASIVFAVPGHILFELGEGYLFGMKRGLALAFAGKSLGAVATFALSRSAMSLCGMREYLREKIEAWPMALQVAETVEEGGMFSVLLLTIAPVPCVLKNYAIPILTDMPMTSYIPGKLLGLLPTTAAHVYFGTLAQSMGDLTGGAATKSLATLGAASTATVLMGILAGYLLREHMAVAKQVPVMASTKTVCDRISEVDEQEYACDESKCATY